MSYKLRQDPAFERFTKKIKEQQLQNKIKVAIEEIQAAPYEAGEQKKGDLSGLFCYDIRHAKVSYEIAYMFAYLALNGLIEEDWQDSQLFLYYF